MNKEWQQTRSGRQAYPLAFTDEMLAWTDVGHALGNICRYTGHTEEFYSVAEHCCLVSDLLGRLAVNPELGRSLTLAGLVHDAAEAYITDLPSPIKHLECFRPYVEAEQRIEAVMAARLGLEFPWSPMVKQADNIVYVAEVRRLMSPKHPDWGLPPVPEQAVEWMLNRISLWSPAEATRQWTSRFNELTEDDDETYGKVLQFTPRGQKPGGDPRDRVVGGL